MKVRFLLAVLLLPLSALAAGCGGGGAADGDADADQDTDAEKELDSILEEDADDEELCVSSATLNEGQVLYAVSGGVPYQLDFLMREFIVKVDRSFTGIGGSYLGFPRVTGTMSEAEWAAMRGFILDRRDLLNGVVCGMADGDWDSGVIILGTPEGEILVRYVWDRDATTAAAREVLQYIAAFINSHVPADGDSQEADRERDQDDSESAEQGDGYAEAEAADGDSCVVVNVDFACDQMPGSEWRPDGIWCVDGQVVTFVTGCFNGEACQGPGSCCFGCGCDRMVVATCLPPEVCVEAGGGSGAGCCVPDGDAPDGDGGPDGDTGTDLCAGALPLACGDTLSHSTVDHGRPSEWYGYSPSARYEGGREVVYRFGPLDSPGQVTIRLRNLTVDLDLFVLGSCNPFDGVGFSAMPVHIQDGGEEVVFAAAAGRVYFVAVDGYDRDEGAYTISATCD